MKSFLLAIFSLALVLGFISCGENVEKLKQEEIAKMEAEFTRFADSLEAIVAEAYTDVALKYWEASLNSNKENWDLVFQADIRFNEILANRETFLKVKSFKDSEMIKDELASRRLEVIYLGMLSKQIDTAKLNRLSVMQSEIENKYSNYRAKVGNKELTDNQVEEVLKNSKNSKELQAVWLAHKNIGPIVKDDILNLVRLRNEIAVELGFSNFHEMSLKLSEQDPEHIERYSTNLMY